MKNWILIPLAVLAAVVASFVTLLLLPSPTQAAPESTPVASDADGLQRLANTLASIEERQARLERSLAEMEALPAPSPAREAAGTDDVERIVAAWMEENVGGSAAAPEPSAVEMQLANSVAAAPLERLIDMLLDDDSFSEIEQQDMWQKVRDVGRMDEVMAELEERCELEPNNPDLRVDLAEAYIQKIFDVGNGPLAGVYGSKADEAYDRALELDPTHWDARFNKAVALSNWPAFLGKTGEAIQNFEILIAQQKDQPQEPQFAQTYLFLGNMYQQTGDAEKALQAWRSGAELFPQDEALLEQLRLADN